MNIKASRYEPTSPEEKIRGTSVLLPVSDRGGFVFMVAYTKKENDDTELLLETLIDQTHRLASSFGKESNPQHRFEQFLGALNETLSENVREGRWSVPIDQLHAMVGIISGGQMFLSGTGELTALFLHKKPSQRYQIFNLFRGIQTEQSLPTWEKPFAVVLDGDLHNGDVFCVSDKDLQTTIEPDELNGILSSLPPVSAVEKIRQYFSHKEALLLVVIKMDDQTNNSYAASTHAVTRADKSVDELMDTQATTDRFLEDQSPSISTAIRRVTQWIKVKTQSKSRVLRDINTNGSFATTLRRIGRSALRVLLFLAKRSMKHAKQAFHALRKKETRDHIKRQVLSGGGAKNRVQSILHSTKQIPRSTQFLVIGIIAAVIILAFGVTTISKSQARSAEEDLYQKSLATIEDTIERASSAVIYKDEDQARTLFLNAQTLIENLPINTPERAEKSVELITDIQSAMDDIRHLVTIPNPPLLADLATVTDGVFGNAIVQTSNSLYTFASDGRVYTLNRSQKTFEAISETTESGSVAREVTQEDDKIYLLDTIGEIYSVTSGEVNSAGLIDTSWVDLQAYADRLYLLRPSLNGQEGQVVRYTRNGSDFTSESNWITSRTVSFDNAVSLTIDGTVYVLMKNGSISRFTSGSEDGWSAGTVEPRITNATDIWTGPDSSYIYVLEPDSQRLIVFDKASGEFLVQYSSSAFTNLSDFTVDESDYTIYLLSGSKLYSIATSHIQ
ncbi:MAG: hypothetical protein HQ488_00575 [Parcubacteria group bacterium]|nr:hypothetical protein [Parcubacteria group bacterium]